MSFINDENLQEILLKLLFLQELKYCNDRKLHVFIAK